MRDKNKSISANEINKYTYCPYQWYYEKIYGAGELQRMHKELSEKMGYKNTLESNFVKGNHFHQNYLVKNKKRKLIKFIIFILIIVIVFILMYKLSYNYFYSGIPQ